ncbi:hypothetical protein HZS_3156 [Henneguya salminicola]|nr:hypothetical protein HZS_3156 [Henneguya salminicola]
MKKTTIFRSDVKNRLNTVANPPTVQGMRAGTIQVTNRIYIDESTNHSHIISYHVWTLRRATSNPVVAISRGRNVTIVLAVNPMDIINYQAIFTFGNSLIYPQYLTNI